jgi:hypothetical protein
MAAIVSESVGIGRDAHRRPADRETAVKFFAGIDLTAPARPSTEAGDQRQRRPLPSASIEHWLRHPERSSSTVMRPGPAADHRFGPPRASWPGLSGGRGFHTALAREPAHLPPQHEPAGGAARRRTFELGNRWRSNVSIELSSDRCRSTAIDRHGGARLDVDRGGVPPLKASTSTSAFSDSMTSMICPFDGSRDAFH